MRTASHRSQTQQARFARRRTNTAAECRGYKTAPPSRLPSWNSRRNACSTWLARIVFVAALLALPSLWAGDELEFAVPDEGRITLGVFDGSGKLVRVLHKLAKEGDFQVGLNGFITSWDGKNDAGGRVTSGHYYVRGYLIGEDVRVSGEDFLFNDWAADNGFPDFSKISDFSLLENGDVILLAEAGSNGASPGGMAAVPSHILDSEGNKWALMSQHPPARTEGLPKKLSDKKSPCSDLPFGHVLARFSPDKGFLWSGKIEATVRGLSGLPAFRQAGSVENLLGGSAASRLLLPPPTSFSPLLASNSTDAAVATGEGSGLYSLEDGTKKRGIPQETGWAPLALAANDSSLFISFSGFLVEDDLPDLSQKSVTTLSPPYAFALDADASTLVGSSPDGVWVRQESFKAVPLPTSIKSVALGMPGTFWFVGIENDAAFVGQYSFSGEVLRVLRPAAEDPKPVKIRASRTVEKFAVLESLPGLQRLRVMARSESGEWTIEWERTLLDSSKFGFVNGKPAADAGSVAQEKTLRFRLKENPLTGKRDFLTLRAEFDASGSRLVSPDGLPLVEVSNRSDLRRTAIRRGSKPDSVRLLQGNGSFVEEFSIGGLDDILPLDAGGIDIP
ncbi:MAG: hypothetical protein WCH98_06590 [Verrucomicrobiota bacterium]